MSKLTLQTLLGAVLGAGYLLLMGVLSIQIIGLSGGAVVNLNNEVIAVTAPSPGFLPLAGICVVTALTLLVFLRQLIRHGRPGDRAALGGFAGALLVGVAIGVSTVIAKYEGQFLSQGFTPGVAGWLEKASLNPAVLTMLLCLVILWCVSPGIAPDRE